MSQSLFDNPFQVPKGRCYGCLHLCKDVFCETCRLDGTMDLCREMALTRLKEMNERVKWDPFLRRVFDEP